MQVLFQIDQNPDSSPDYIRTFVADELKFPELESFSLALVDGVQSHRNQIDLILERSAQNWKVGRMAAVDRAILRLAVYEMVFQDPPTPTKVVITEAVEIARRFSTNESARFVNGVLDGVTRSRSGEPPADSPPPADQDAKSTDAD